MKTIKVNFKNFWQNFDRQSWLEKAFRSLNDFNLIYDPNDADLEICSTFGNESLSAKIPSVLWALEGIWSIEDFNISQYQHTFYFFPEDIVDHPSYCRINMTPPGFIKKIEDPTKVIKTHTKFCNFVYRNPVEYRNNFFSQLSKYKHIDSPGLCMNNMPPLGNHSDPLKSRKANDWAQIKTDFIKNYKFTIGIENHIVAGYVTEKIVQPLGNGSIPIYWGNPYVADDFNPDAFINYHDYNNMDEFIDRIIQVDKDDDLYFKMLRSPKALKTREPIVINKWRTILKQL